jgi:hypothetical protein
MEKDLTIRQRLDRIEARQILLYEKLFNILSPRQRRWLADAWNEPEVREPPLKEPA